MSVPMRPRPMNPTEPGFVARMAAPFADAAPMGLERSSLASLTMSLPPKEKSSETDRRCSVVRAVPCIHSPARCVVPCERRADHELNLMEHHHWNDHEPDLPCEQQGCYRQAAGEAFLRSAENDRDFIAARKPKAACSQKSGWQSRSQAARRRRVRAAGAGSLQSDARYRLRRLG